MLSAENYDISSMETIAVVANRESSCDEELGSARVEIAGGKEAAFSNDLPSKVVDGEPRANTN